jgi:hypothetical protein
MKRLWWLIALGILFAAVGSVWTQQGMKVLGGSAMSGSSFWATVGPIVLVVGVLLVVIAVVARRRKRTG